MCTGAELTGVAWEAALADAYPGYRFARLEAGPGWRWSAVALDPGTHPWCVVTRDPREFARHLPVRGTASAPAPVQVPAK